MPDYLATNRQLARKGLCYWAPGPVTGTLWALDSDQTPMLVGDNGDTAPPIALARYRVLEIASADPDRQLVFLAGGYAYGIAVPIREPHEHKPTRWVPGSGWTPTEIPADAGCWQVIPFDFDTRITHANFDGSNMSKRLTWTGCPERPANGGAG